MPLIAGLGAIVLPLYQQLFDFQGGRFSIDQSGITMYIGLKQWHHPWEEVKFCGIVGISVGDGNTYWVYFSRRLLSLEEKRAFLRKTRRDLKNIAFFQYNAEVLQEVLPFIPPDIAETIRQCAQQIDPQISWIEKTYHK